jgi:predicted dehydrogenase
MLREACKLMADYYAALRGTVMLWFRRADPRRRIAAATAVTALVLMGVHGFDSVGSLTDRGSESAAANGSRRGSADVSPRGDDDPPGATTGNDRGGSRGEAVRPGAGRSSAEALHGADVASGKPDDGVAMPRGTAPSGPWGSTDASSSMSQTSGTSDQDNGSTRTTQPAGGSQTEPSATEPQPATNPSATQSTPTGSDPESECNPTGGVVGRLVDELLCVADDLL